METDKPQCGTPLVRTEVRAPAGRDEKTQPVNTPIRPYPYRSVISWIASLLSMAALEALVESSWDTSQPSESGAWSDIFHAPAIRNFLGPDGQLFSRRQNGAIHLVFGLYIDWFNPGGNKKGGKARS
ncbi:hypothetical protein OH77DRAFT_1489010, partial [Trametes cingulata]